MASESIQKNVIAGKLVNIEHRSGKTVKGADYVGGNVMIEVGEDNIVPVSFFATQQKKDGTPNPLYASLQTVIKDYKSIAANGREEADYVEVGVPRLVENSFYVRDGQLIRGFQFNSPFFNRKATVDAKGEFNIVGEIIKVADDIVKDVPTGNLTVTLLVVTYGNTANLIDFQVEGEKAVNYVKTNFSPGMEVKLTGDILVVETIEEKVTEAAFGKPITEEIRKTQRKLLVQSATPPVDSKITDEERQTMLSERESKLQNMKQDFMSKQKGNGKSSGAANFSL